MPIWDAQSGGSMADIAKVWDVDASGTMREIGTIWDVDTAGNWHLIWQARQDLFGGDVDYSSLYGNWEVSAGNPYDTWTGGWDWNTVTSAFTSGFGPYDAWAVYSHQRPIDMRGFNTLHLTAQGNIDPNQGDIRVNVSGDRGSRSGAQPVDDWQTYSFDISAMDSGYITVYCYVVGGGVPGFSRINGAWME